MLNDVKLHGRLTADPELRSTSSGKKVVSFTVAVAGNSAKAPTEFIPVVAFDNIAENIAKHLKKGSEIVVDGHIHMSSHKGKDDKTYRTTDIIIDAFDFCGSKGAQAKPDDADADACTTDEYIEDDLEPDFGS